MQPSTRQRHRVNIKNEVMLLKMIPAPILNRMKKNYKLIQIHLKNDLAPTDHSPLLRLHCMETGVTLLLSEYDAVTHEFYGLRDMALGRVELGQIALSEIKAILPVLFIDCKFKPEGTLMAYLRAAYNRASPRLGSLE